MISVLSSAASRFVRLGSVDLEGLIDKLLPCLVQMSAGPCCWTRGHMIATMNCIILTFSCSHDP